VRCLSSVFMFCLRYVDWMRFVSLGTLLLVFVHLLWLVSGLMKILNNLIPFCEIGFSQIRDFSLEWVLGCIKLVNKRRVPICFTNLFSDCFPSVLLTTQKRSHQIWQLLNSISAALTHIIQFLGNRRAVFIFINYRSAIPLSFGHLPDFCISSKTN